jgi:hypothetical protein
VEVMDFNTVEKNNMKPKYLKINSRDLMIPDHAQRKFNQRHGDKLAADWDMGKFKPLDVSFRDGKYWVIDGQHRLYAMKKRKGGDCTILCYVHYGMTIQDEAEFFLDQLKNTKTILTTDRMRIRFTIGDETVIGMVRGAEKAGFIVDFSNHKANGRITALAALEAVYNAISHEEYIKMLTVLKKAYNGRVDSVCREMLLGMGLFFNKYYGQFDPNALANTLKTSTTPTDILVEGHSYDARHGDGKLYRGKPYARAILNVYNCRRKKNVLPDIL